MGTPPTKPKRDVARVEAKLVKLAMSYPGAVEENPWGHRAFKVRKKTFMFLAASGDGLSFSLKLPESGALALELPFCEPTGYGLGKSGWVSGKFTKGKDVPVDMIAEWLDESYRAIAPKKLIKELDA